MKDPKKRQIPSALQDNVLSLIAIFSVLALTIAVVFAMLWLLDRAEIVPLADRFFPSDTDRVNGGENSAPSAYDILRDEAENAGNGNASSEVIRYSGDFSTLYALLENSEQDTSYYAEYDTTFGSRENTTTYHIILLRHENTFRIERYPLTSPNLVEYYVCDGESVVYTDPHTKESATFAYSDAFFAEALAGIPTVASFCDDQDKIIDTAAYTEIGGEVVYYIRFHHHMQEDSTKQIYEEYWISAERELVIRCHTYAKNDPSSAGLQLFSSDTKIMRELTDTEQKTLAHDAMRTEAAK